MIAFVSLTTLQYVLMVLTILSEAKCERRKNGWTDGRTNGWTRVISTASTVLTILIF